MTDIFLFFAWGWVLFHLIQIKLYGIITITEPNQVILWAEIILMIFGLIFVIGKLIYDIKQIDKGIKRKEVEL